MINHYVIESAARQPRSYTERLAWYVICRAAKHSTKLPRSFLARNDKIL
jgi:hypothetical protein